MNALLIIQTHKDTGVQLYAVEFDHNGRRKRTAWTDTEEHAYDLWADIAFMALDKGADK